MVDEDLIRDAQTGVPGAIDQLLDRWLPVVMRWCLRRGATPTDAEDATHDVFLVVLRKLDGLNEARAFPAWLYGITRRVLAAQRRKAWVRRWVPGVQPKPVDLQPNPLQMAESSEIGRRVWAALAQLSDKHREVLILSDLEERPDSEVAALLDVPKGTVKSRLRRARAHLRALVPELGADIIHLDTHREESA